MIFNENNPYCAQWLKNLYPEAFIDNRSIKDVVEYSHPRVHLFAGIGGWELALELADWPSDRPVWTGSCPCQPFSIAGKQRKENDGRHLWPEMLRLISIYHPPTIFGEQVAGNAGRGWLSRVRIDLETLGYAVGAADLCAAGVGAKHQRQRLFWVANSNSNRTVGNIRNSNNQKWYAKAQVQERENVITRPDSTSSFARGLDSWKIEPNVGRVVDGFPTQMEQLRAYGNAIVPQIAATFIKAFMEIEK